MYWYCSVVVNYIGTALNKMNNFTNWILRMVTKNSENSLWVKRIRYYEPRQKTFLLFKYLLLKYISSIHNVDMYTTWESLKLKLTEETLNCCFFLPCPPENEIKSR